MRILVAGATGFIGQAVAQRLHEDGHLVTGLGRNIRIARARMPDIAWVSHDLTTIASASDWLPLLKDADAVINCAGALQDGLRDNLMAVQQNAMTALYAAALTLKKLPLIVQISAPADLSASATAFIATKLAADHALATSGLPHVILRPTLVIGRNAYGGTALLRALASAPGIVALTDAETTINAVHLDDVAGAVADAINGTLPSGSDVVLAGQPDRSLGDTVLLHRAWLGLPPARIVQLPSAIATAVSWFADIAGRLGWRSPLRSTATTIGRIGIGISAQQAVRYLADPLARLMRSPAGAQDLWFARLYLIKPLLIVTLALFWMTSGTIPLFRLEDTSRLFAGSLPEPAALSITIITSLLDIALGLAVLVQPLARKAMLGMLLVSLAYLASATLLQPALWIDPLGPLVKVVPSMLLTLIGLVIMRER